MIFGYEIENTSSKSKNRQVKLHQTTKTVYNKGNNSEKATYGKGENIENHISDKRLPAK